MDFLMSPTIIVTVLAAVMVPLMLIGIGMGLRRAETVDVPAVPPGKRGARTTNIEV